MTIVSNWPRTTKETTTGHELIFDTQTGEVLESQKVTIKKYNITTDEGTHCRFPIAARTSEEPRDPFCS